MSLCQNNISLSLPFYLKSLFTLLVLVTLFPFSGKTQSVLVRDSAPSLTKSEQDTVRAIHHLFQIKRKKSGATTSLGVFTMLVGVGTVQVIGGAVGAPASGRTAASFIFSLPGLVLTAVGISKRARFNQTNELATVQTYKEKKQLPTSVLQQLKPDYFR